MKRVVVILVGLVVACGSSQPAPPPSVPVAPVETASAARPSAAEPADRESAPEPSAAPGAPLADPAAALAAAKKDTKPAFIVFCAQWATACKELARSLADSNVKKALDERFVFARVDATDDEDAATRKRLEQFKVNGVPTMLVFDRKGKEVARAESYIAAPDVLALLEKAK